MSIFSYIKSIYALDTIDTRFTSSSATPYKAVVDARISSAAAASKRDDSITGVGVKTDHSGRPIAQPSKWKTPEFYFYYFIFIITVPYMFWVAYDVSRRGYKPPISTDSMTDFCTASDKNYAKYEHLLSPGWVPGRKIVSPKHKTLQAPLMSVRTSLMLNTRASEKMCHTSQSSWSSTPYSD